MSSTECLFEILACDEVEGLPFSPNVNEWRVLQLLQQIEADSVITPAIVSLVKQWVKFNQWTNQFEGEPYVTEVAQVYSKIDAILTAHDRQCPTGGE